MNASLVLAQTLLTLAVEGDGPVRFGFPLEERMLARGLSVEGCPGARVQWRPLQPRKDPATGRVWVELAIAPARGTLRVCAGARGSERGSVCDTAADTAEEDAATVTIRRWRWWEGSVDETTRRTWRLEQALADGEVMHAGESWTEPGPGHDERWLRVRIARAEWERAGILPRDQGLARALRGELARIAGALQELPGRRGAGDYGRSGGIVTNLEFDTILGLARLGLAQEDRALLARALRGARHLRDIDLDSATGLPFCHGPDHRTAPPEPGHAWLSGLLLVGCLAADDELIAAARGIARGLAFRPGGGEGRRDRARDLGWPLLELETWLAFADDVVLARAANAQAAALLARHDPVAAVVRFGEGERRGGLYEERCWITGGILLPALRAVRRRGEQRGVDDVLASLSLAHLRRIESGREGLPLRVLLDGRKPVEELRIGGAPELALLLEGIAPDSLPGTLQRAGVRRALVGLLREDDPDLATSWSKVARCSWVLR